MVTGRWLSVVSVGTLRRAVFVSLPTQILCDHCGYVSKSEAKRLSEVGASGAWICPACILCNTTYHLDDGFCTVLGYHRDLEVGFI